ncbi:MAG: hypothetical protein WBZ36_27010 [Candidatus Nitrosopolaris sp.]
MIFCQDLAGYTPFPLKNFVFLRGSAEILRSGEFPLSLLSKIGIIFLRVLLRFGPVIRHIASNSSKLHHLKMKVGPSLTRFL